MDSIGFEFVKTDGKQGEMPQFQIKAEPTEDVLFSETKVFDGGDVGKSKCGEIFTLPNTEHFILICAFCNAEFAKMQSFGLHVRKKHESSHTTAATSIEATTPVPEVASKLVEQTPEHDHREIAFDALLDVDEPAVSAKQELLIPEPFAVVTAIENIASDNKSYDDDIERNDDEISLKTPSETSSVEGSDYEENLKLGKKANRGVKCDGCSKTYKTKRTLYMHQKASGCKQEIKPLNPDLFCVPCNRQFKTPKTFVRHEKSHETRVKKECDDNLGSEGVAPSQAKTEPVQQDPSLYCELCNRYFKTKTNLRTHGEKHDTLPAALQGDPEFLKCKFCDEPCADLPARKEHETTHTEDRPYICKICNKTFPTIYKKNVHVALHSGERPHQCPSCPNKYLTKRDVLRHITYRHLNVRQFKCDFCDKSCFRKTELAIHMRRHTGEKPYVCEDCGNRFAALSQLKSHQLRHTQTKNYKCDQCGRFFYSSTSLKDHQASHSDAKPFGCDVCGRRFPRAKALKKHKKLHSDVKSYICNICGKAYAQDSGLYAHKKSHGLFSNPQGTQFTVPLS